MLNTLKGNMKSQIVNGLQNESDVYYGRFKGTSDVLPLLVKNLLRPGRFLEKARFGQAPLLPSFMQAGKPYPAVLDKFIEGDRWQKPFSELNTDGITILPEYFSAEQCDALIDALNVRDAFNHEGDEYKGNDVVLRLNELTTSFWLAMPLVAMLGKYLQRFPYARNYPSLSIAKPSFSSMPTREIDAQANNRFAFGWHYDTANLVQFHVLLNDTEDDGSCMQVIAGTHRKHHVKLSVEDYWLSDEYIEKRRLPVVNCTGKRGTVYLFDSNAYHRFRAVKGRLRSMLACEFTPGNNILTNCSIVAESLSENVHALDALTPIQREILSGLYPAPPSAGFRFEQGRFVGDQSHL